MTYVKEKYGAHRVAQIATFGTMGARGVIKDVGRALGKPFELTNEITKYVPDYVEDPDTGEKSIKFTLRDALDEKDKNGEYTSTARTLREYADEESELFKIALRLEGIPRQTGIHAAGIIVSPVDLTEIAPLMRNNDDMMAVQFDMNTAAELGLVKYDFLGLSTLTVIDNVLQSIKEHTGEDINLRNLPLDDQAVYDLLTTGRTLGVFQVESYMFRELLRGIKPTCFADISAALALGRPGPLDAGMDKVYIANKNGYRAKQYPHPDLEPILANTEGILLYQEQLMLTARKIAGFNIAEADALRKAIGKKKQAQIKELGEKFIKQAMERKYDQVFVEDLWSQMETFGRYGFNVAHSTSYGVLTYRTAWLKAHYPTHFLAAVLTNEAKSNAKGADESYKAAIAEAKRANIKLLPPDVNESDEGFIVHDKDSIRCGLIAVRGIGAKAVDAIKAGRPYSDLEDFLDKVDLRVCNKKVMHAAILSGMFDTFNEDRLGLLHAYYDFREEDVPDEVSLDRATKLKIPDEYTKEIQLAWERSLFGLYLTSSPLDMFVLPSWEEANIGDKIDTVGIIMRVNRIITRKGDPMAFVDVETNDGNLDIVVFPRVFDECDKKLEKNTIIRIRGKKEAGAKVIADMITVPRIPGLKALTGGM